jgi:DNA helicase HerA-like ATPase
MRLVLAIDEARQVLGYEHQSLISLVRESRSKGGVMVFISQSPDDFDQRDENFLENIGLGVCFRTNARSSALNSLLGGPADVSGLPSGVCVTRLADRGLTYVMAWKQRDS